MRLPVLLPFYLGFARLSALIWRAALARRARDGREDPQRVAEKHGQASVARPSGQVIWFHAVSVGEVLALLKLLDRLHLARPDVHVLLTTVTLASAQSLAERELPANVIHQYAPADYPGAVKRFLDHWHPSAVVVAEADMWPLILTQAKSRGLRMILLNTHVTERRYRRRKFAVASNGALMALFERIYVQDETSRARFVDLGAPTAKMQVMGVLKAASDPPPDNPEKRSDLDEQIGPRPRWLAASTKVIEEPQLFDAHAQALVSLPDLLMIIAPRQMREADNTEAAARACFPPERIARRSRGDRITAQTSVYIADTIGEMGLWYRMVPVAYTGNSMPVPGKPLTGKNPFEAAALGVMILHGPHVGNFAEAYARLHERGGALEVCDSEAMARAVVEAQNPDWRASYITAARQVQAENAYPLEIALGAVLEILAPPGA